LNYDALRAACSSFSTDLTARDYYGKTSCIDVILDHFDSCRDFILSCSFETLQVYLEQQNLMIDSDMSRFNMISMFFETVYGTPVALTLRKSPWPVLESFCIPDDFTVDDMPWLTTELTPWMTRLPRKLLIGRLKCVF
jgi:hypothetical protein